MHVEMGSRQNGLRRNSHAEISKSAQRLNRQHEIFNYFILSDIFHIALFQIIVYCKNIIINCTIP